MGDVYVYDLKEPLSLSDSDYVLVNIGTGLQKIKFSILKQAISNILSQSEKEKIGAIIVDEDGTKFLDNSGNYRLLTKDDISDLDISLPVASEEVLGGVKIDGDTIKINDGVISADVIGNWTAGVYYPVGYFAVYNKGLIQCNTAHISGTSYDSTESANWTLVSGGLDVNFVMRFIYNMAQYATGSSPNSDGSINTNNDSGALMKKGGLSSSTFITGITCAGEKFGIQVTNSLHSSGAYNVTNHIVDIIAPWTASKNYKRNYFVTYDNKLYQCKTEHTSGTSFDETYWQLIGGEGGSTSGTVINNWSASTDYVIGDLVINDTTLYQCNTEHTSGESFDDTEGANWTALSGAQGVKGDDGYSPTASVEQTDTGCTVTITDKNGTTTANLTNGTNGDDGISPTATITQTETGATISITDSTGTTAADILNGTDGNDGITPHIDETTKHWFIGEVDTGVVAEGATIISTTSTNYSGVLSVDNWTGDSSPFTQSVVIEGVSADLSPFIDLIVSDDIATGTEEQLQWSYITKAVTGDGKIIFSCYENKPTININFKVKVI